MKIITEIAGRVLPDLVKLDPKMVYSWECDAFPALFQSLHWQESGSITAGCF